MFDFICPTCGRSGFDDEVCASCEGSADDELVA
jgi:hypothetical protein